jgi:hypothetical protein
MARFHPAKKPDNLTAMRRFTAAIMSTSMNAAFAILVQKGHFNWVPDWVLECGWIICGLILLWCIYPMALAAVPGIFRSITIVDIGLLDHYKAPIVRRRLTQRQMLVGGLWPPERWSVTGIRFTVLGGA